MDKENILILKNEDYNIPNSKSYHVITKEKDFFENPEQYITKVENWFKKLSERNFKNGLDEPARLLEKNEFNAAVISAVIQLEVKLRKLIKEKTAGKVFARGFFELARMACDKKIIRKGDLEQLKHWSYIRNQIVHSEMSLQEQKARSIVDEITGYTKALKEV